jgi:hypothetical protein
MEMYTSAYLQAQQVCQVFQRGRIERRNRERLESLERDEKRRLQLLGGVKSAQQWNIADQLCIP